MSSTDQPQVYTDQQATDEAVLLLTRRMRRLHQGAFDSVLRSLPDGVREALTAAERRADRVRAAGGAYQFDASDE